MASASPMAAKQSTVSDRAVTCLSDSSRFGSSLSKAMYSSRSAASPAVAVGFDTAAAAKAWVASSECRSASSAAFFCRVSAWSVVDRALTSFSSEAEHAVVSEPTSTTRTSKSAGHRRWLGNAEV